MFCWKFVSASQHRRIEAISLLLSNDYPLLEFLFEQDQPQLRAAPEELMSNSWPFSAGEMLLVRLALDLWNESGDVRICEALERLDGIRFQNLLLSLEYLGGNIECGGRAVSAN